MLGKAHGGHIGCLNPTVDDAKAGIRVLGGHLSHRVGEQEANADYEVVDVSRQAQQLRPVGAVAVGGSIRNDCTQLVLGSFETNVRGVVEAPVATSTDIEHQAD